MDGCSNTGGDKGAGAVRQLKRLSSVQTLMPKVVEESEETEGCSQTSSCRQRRTNSSPIIGSDITVEPITSVKQANSVALAVSTCASQPIKPVNTQADSPQYSMLPKPFHYLTDSPPSAQHIPDVCEDKMMSLPSTFDRLRGSNQTESNLLGVPQYFLSSAAPDLTQQSADADLDKNISATLVANSSPDLLRVDSLPPDRGLRACSVPVDVSSKCISPDDDITRIKHDSSSSSKADTDTQTDSESSSKQQNQNRIFGRFSSVDESVVSEQKGEELESKFVYLTSSLSTQKDTLMKRIEVSRHTRASTEESLMNEVNSLLEEIRELMMKDGENKFQEELRMVERRLQRVVPLASKLATKAETYGAVKQEHKQLNSAESMALYVEHVKRLHVRESSDHQATRLRLTKAQQEWNIGEGGDNSVNVNITRRSSNAVGGYTQKRRASVALTALPNILGGQGLKQLSMDPKSRFQQLVRKSSSSNAFRRTSQDSNSSDCTELPAVTISQSKSTDSPDNSNCVTPVAGLTPRSSLSAPSEKNNNSDTYNLSHLAVIKTITAVMPSVQTVEKVEKSEVKSTIRRRRSIKRSETSGSQRNSIDSPQLYSRKSKESDQLSVLMGKLDNFLSEHRIYRLCKDKYKIFDRTYTSWRGQLRQIVFISFICICYLQMKTLLS